MSQVASLEPCRELYELSMWDDTDYGYMEHVERRHGDSWTEGTTSLLVESVIAHQIHWQPTTPNALHTELKAQKCPAYAAGYLLRKLPPQIDGIYDLLLSPTSGGKWLVGYYEPDGQDQYETLADTPENALCKLAIKLHKAGVLTKGGGDE